MEAKEIAEGLSEAQQKLFVAFSADWQAGPNMQGEMIPAIKPGETLGLIERRFMDKAPATYSARGDELFVKVSACWFFRLTPLGLEVRKILLRKNP